MDEKSKHIKKFYADWCGPCKAITPMIDSIRDKINVIDVDVESDAGRSLAVEFSVRSLPTLILMEGGTVLDKKVGLRNADELNEWISTKTKEI